VITDTKTIGRGLMMNEPRLQIYKGMIQYLLVSTPYTLKNIADLSHSSIKNIRSIYCDEQIPRHFSSELNLVKLYHSIVELNLHEMSRLRKKSVNVCNGEIQ
jgi:hypothetical protein